MPAADTTLETTPPGAARRRTWAHPEVRSHSLVVLTFDRLLAAPLAGAPEPEVVSAAEDGHDPLDPPAVAIDLIAVRRVRLDLLSNALVVEYAKGGPGTSRITVVFENPEGADACYTELWRRLGDGYKLQPYTRSAWAAARAPLALLAGALLVTAALALVLSVFEDMASARAAAKVSTPGLGGPDGAKALPQSPLEVLIGWMNWRAVCGAGGVVAAVAQVWLYRRLTRPPAALELAQA